MNQTILVNVPNNPPPLEKETPKEWIKIDLDLIYILYKSIN